MAFRFRLESLLRLRRRRQEQSEAELAKQIHLMEQARNAAAQATLRLKEEEMDLSFALRSGMLAAECQTRAQHLELLREDQAERRRQLARREIEFQKARHLFSKRHGELQVVERLRERHYERYLAEEHKTEQKEADDLASVNFVRKRKGPHIESSTWEVFRG